MNTVYRISPEQVANLRYSLIISEALEDAESAQPADSGVSNDYTDYAQPDMNRQPNDPNPTEKEKGESAIFGDLTKGLYNYAQTYNMPSKIATEIERANPEISVPTAKSFIEKLLYGVYQMANDPSQNEAFERFLRSIGVTLTAELLTKDNELQ
jgi:hypothetical protein